MLGVILEYKVKYLMHLKSHTKKSSIILDYTMIFQTRKKLKEFWHQNNQKKKLRRRQEEENVEKNCGQGYTKRNLRQIQLHREIVDLKKNMQIK